MGVLKNLSIFTRKQVCWILFLKTACNFMKKTIQYTCFGQILLKSLKGIVDDSSTMVAFEACIEAITYAEWKLFIIFLIRKINNPSQDIWGLFTKLSVSIHLIECLIANFFQFSNNIVETFVLGVELGTYLSLLAFLRFSWRSLIS